MKEYEQNLLNRYPIDIISIRQTRGAYLCDTRQGIFLFQRLSSSKKRIPYVQYLSEQLMENGFEAVSFYLRSESGEYVSHSGDGTGYVVKRWFAGRECDVRREADIIETVRTMAEFHLALDEVSRQLRQMSEMIQMDEVCEHFQGESLEAESNRHNRELKKVRRFIRGRVGKDELERLYLSSFDEVYELAVQVTALVEQSACKALWERMREQRTIAHGAWNYHNVLLSGNETAVVNLEHFRMDTQMVDLYHFLRKVMEKRAWDRGLAEQILDTYNRRKPIREEERMYLILRLAYPEKFWKITNSYYNSNKAWFSAKNLEKMKLAVEEIPVKKRLLYDLFAFHL